MLLSVTAIGERAVVAELPTTDAFNRPESLDALGSAALTAMPERLILSGDTDTSVMPEADGATPAASGTT